MLHILVIYSSLVCCTLHYVLLLQFLKYYNTLPPLDEDRLVQLLAKSDNFYYDSNLVLC